MGSLDLDHDCGSSNESQTPRRLSVNSIFNKWKMERFTGYFVMMGLTLALSVSILGKLLKSTLLQSSGESSLFKTLCNYFDFTSVYSYLGLIIVCLSIYGLHMLFFAPMNRIRTLGEVGYIEEGKFSKKEIANAVRKRRVVGDVPPVYPNGWFGIIESRFLQKGKSINISMLGKLYLCT